MSQEQKTVRSASIWQSQTHSSKRSGQYRVFLRVLSINANFSEHFVDHEHMEDKEVESHQRKFHRRARANASCCEHSVDPLDWHEWSSSSGRKS